MNIQGIEAARVTGNQPPLSGSVRHLHRLRGRCEPHPVGRVSALLLGTPCRHAPRRAGRDRSRRRQGGRCREADQAHKEGPLASDQVGDPTARRQTPERERVCGNHSPPAVIERPQSPPGRGQNDVHDRGAQGHHRLRQGDHAQAHHRSGSGDSSSDRSSAVAEVPPGVSPARMRSVRVSRLLTASAPSRRGRRDGQCALPRCRPGRRSRRPW